jgi:hypothetical protein
LPHVLDHRANEYHFVTTWRIDAAIAEVADILADPPAMRDWWPSLCTELEEIEAGDAAAGTGRAYRIHAKGWAPYIVRWYFRITENRYPQRFAFDSWGDLVGRGVWTLEHRDGVTFVKHDWKIRGDKRIFRYGSTLLKPLFAANHDWAMRRGEEGLALEIARRRAKSAAERERVARPPEPTFRWAIRLDKIRSKLVRKLVNDRPGEVPTAAD